MSSAEHHPQGLTATSPDTARLLSTFLLIFHGSLEKREEQCLSVHAPFNRFVMAITIFLLQRMLRRICFLERECFEEGEMNHPTYGAT